MIQPDQVFKTLKSPVGAPPHVVDWTVPSDLPYLQGHFPDQPILPAIAIIDASTYLLQCALEQPGLAVKAVANAKFLSPIVPGTQVQIQMTAISEREWTIDWLEAGSRRELASLTLAL